VSDLVIRPYRPADRAQVRRICHQTGFMGEPADWYWRDETSFANIWTGYYTDVEPESAFVVEDATGVLGYLLGCLDTSRAPSAQRAIVREIVRRQLVFRPGTAAFFRRAIADVARDPRVGSGELDDPRYPSHLHIDLLPAARGRGAGRRLMDAWFERLGVAGSPGCHLGTMAENTGAIAFFEAVGFERHGQPQLLPGMRTRTGGRMHAQLMVRGV
jgi:ribosomal protein S18 acetylase RimI-like enzyme